MILTLVLGALALVGSFFTWCYIHEKAHVLMVKYLVGLQWAEIKPYPHVDKVAGFRWAGCRYLPERNPTPTENALISLAPRLPGIVACAMAPLAVFLSMWALIPTMLWIIFWGAGIVDLINGSLGISQYSDLKKAAAGFKISPWLLRPLMLLALPTLTVISLYVIAFLSGF
jgi:hypothetical protein